MAVDNFFRDRAGHLRSGWRLAIFAVAFIVCLQVTHALLLNGLSLALHQSPLEIGAGNWSVLAGHGSILISALLVGWGCGALFEDLPLRALGCMPHRGWWKNLAFGFLLGAASLLLAAGLAALARGIH